jgi:hypothetical protein
MPRKGNSYMALTPERRNEISHSILKALFQLDKDEFEKPDEPLREGWKEISETTGIPLHEIEQYVRIFYVEILEMEKCQAPSVTESQPVPASK